MNQYRGEAYFTRACKYAVLVSFFGDVVWLDKNIYIEEAFQKGRTPKKEIIPLIYQDFDKAISMLPVSYTGNSTQRFTKGAALAMKARFALYMGDWELAAESAKACMNLQAYQLHPDFSDLFLMNTKNSIESILVFPRSVQYNILYDATATKMSCLEMLEDTVRMHPLGTCWLRSSVQMGCPLTSHLFLIPTILSRTVTPVVLPPL